MTIIKVSKASGEVLDWMVARCEGVAVEHVDDGITRCLLRVSPSTGRYNPSVDWAQGGPIIEREKIRFDDLPDNGIRAFIRRPIGKSEMLLMDCWDKGVTPLIAAMRCYCCAKLGDTVDVPEGLL